MAEKIDFSQIGFLIIEENDLSTDLVSGILRALGAEMVYCTKDTTEAQQLLRRNEIDVMILEWNIAPMNGLEIMDWLRRSVQSPNRLLPTMMITVNTEEDFVRQARDFGVNEFLAKPYTPDQLFRRLVSLITNPRSYINSEEYFGPDRRRLRKKRYLGLERRDIDEDDDH